MAKWQAGVPELQQHRHGTDPEGETDAVGHARHVPWALVWFESWLGFHRSDG